LFADREPPWTVSRRASRAGCIHLSPSSATQSSPNLIVRISRFVTLLAASSTPQNLRPASSFIFVNMRVIITIVLALQLYMCFFSSGLEAAVLAYAGCQTAARRLCPHQTGRIWSMSAHTRVHEWSGHTQAAEPCMSAVHVNVTSKVGAAAASGYAAAQSMCAGLLHGVQSVRMQNTLSQPGTFRAHRSFNAFSSPSSPSPPSYLPSHVSCSYP
jgi:hypothetical protein